MGLREIFAKNLKRIRRNSGFSQAKLAEMANVSTHHIAMIERTRNFPKTDLIERIAEVLNIEIFELFMDENSSRLMEAAQLRSAIKDDMQQILKDFLEELTMEKCPLKNDSKIQNFKIPKNPNK